MIVLIFVLLCVATGIALWSKLERLSVSIFGLTFILAVVAFVTDITTVLTISL